MLSASPLLYLFTVQVAKLSRLPKKSHPDPHLSCRGDPSAFQIAPSFVIVCTSVSVIFSVKMRCYDHDSPRILYVVAHKPPESKTHYVFTSLVVIYGIMLYLLGQGMFSLFVYWVHITQTLIFVLWCLYTLIFQCIYYLSSLILNSLLSLKKA